MTATAKKEADMKGIAIVLSVAALLSFSAGAFASDWDLVGKVLTGVEGARILTGGRVDIIGSVMDIGGLRRGEDRVVRQERVIVVERPAACERVWVPHYTWKKVWVPGHTEWDPELGKVYIEGHYAKYKVEDGGHWEYAYSGKIKHCSSRGYRR